MAKAKMTNLAQALRLVDVLPENDRATLRDYLRPAPMPRTKKAKKAKPADPPTLPLVAESGATADAEDGPKCVACGNTEDYQDHFEPSPHYHAFQPPRGKKSAKAAASGDSA